MTNVHIVNVNSVTMRDSTWLKCVFIMSTVSRCAAFDIRKVCHIGRHWKYISWRLKCCYDWANISPSPTRSKYDNSWRNTFDTYNHWLAIKYLGTIKYALRFNTCRNRGFLDNEDAIWDPHLQMNPSYDVWFVFNTSEVLRLACGALLAGCLEFRWRSKSPVDACPRKELDQWERESGISAPIQITFKGCQMTITVWMTLRSARFDMTPTSARFCLRGGSDDDREPSDTYKCHIWIWHLQVPDFAYAGGVRRRFRKQNLALVSVNHTVSFQKKPLWTYRKCILENRSSVFKKETSTFAFLLSCGDGTLPAFLLG